MKPGKYISFKLEKWKGDVLFFKTIKTKVVSICEDPLGFYESKCTVEVNGEGYGIPFSEVLEVFPADNEQLTLF